ncbi:mediator of RNA polymerase II transcription subunit 7-like [Thomomys bottae]
MQRTSQGEDGTPQSSNPGELGTATMVRSRTLPARGGALSRGLAQGWHLEVQHLQAPVEQWDFDQASSQEHHEVEQEEEEEVSDRAEEAQEMVPPPGDSDTLTGVPDDFSTLGEPQQLSRFPLPPVQYIKEYMDENIQKGLAPKPPPPIKDSFMLFGDQFHGGDLTAPLERSQGIQWLHPRKFNYKKELKKLSRSILINFLDLLDILIRSPGSTKREEQLDDLKLLFESMHQLINEYRSHQAQENLSVMVEGQKWQWLEMAERFQKQLEQLEMSQACLPGDLPHLEAGMTVQTEPRGSEESNNWTGQKEQQRASSGWRRDQILQKDAALCALIDEMNGRP